MTHTNTTPAPVEPYSRPDVDAALLNDPAYRDLALDARDYGIFVWFFDHQEDGWSMQLDADTMSRARDLGIII